MITLLKKLTGEMERYQTGKIANPPKCEIQVQDTNLQKPNAPATVSTKKISKLFKSCCQGTRNQWIISKQDEILKIQEENVR